MDIEKPLSSRVTPRGGWMSVFKKIITKELNY